MNRMQAPLVLACVAALASCRPEAGPPTRVAPAGATPRVTTPVNAAKAPPSALDGGAAPARSKGCQPLASGEISDDETPSVRGVSTDSVELLPWLEARGVTNRGALSFFASHYVPGGIDLAKAENYFASGGCFELVVGDNAEPALLCKHDIPYPLVESHAVVVVVRSKHPRIVLDVGLNLIALDWPDARWLDLALEVKDHGRVVELRDRAANGTKLVAPVSECLAREATLDRCERDFANEPNPESFAQAAGNGEWFDLYHQACPIERGPDGKLRVRREKSVLPFDRYPATIHDCAGGRAALLGAGREVASSSDRTDWRRSLAFFDRSCSQRGTWVWKGDRFVRRPSPP